ncbi:hypothetical protein [Pelagibacterium montanilacus]|uniref:hypothetical protein n=1 Tax=Pelagibacterium montanilacus TaxID=2185280 RepID=UPI000F8E8509|nr:hypothetical protein [Pelagibacterium montanilacus]
MSPAWVEAVDKIKDGTSQACRSNWIETLFGNSSTDARAIGPGSGDYYTSKNASTTVAARSWPSNPISPTAEDHAKLKGHNLALQGVSTDQAEQWRLCHLGRRGLRRRTILKAFTVFADQACEFLEVLCL